MRALILIGITSALLVQSGMEELFKSVVNNKQGRAIGGAVGQAILQGYDFATIGDVKLKDIGATITRLREPAEDGF